MGQIYLQDLRMCSNKNRAWIERYSFVQGECSNVFTGRSNKNRVGTQRYKKQSVCDCEKR